MNLKKIGVHFIDVASYITWSLCIYVLSYFSINNIEVGTSYRLSGFILMIASIWLYRTKGHELVKELLKVTGISVGTIIVGKIIGDSSIDMSQSIKLAISNIVHATILGGGMIFINKKGIQVHGEKTYTMQTVMLAILIILIFILKVPIIIAFGVYIFIDMTYGYKVYLLKNISDRKAKSEQEEKNSEKKKRGKKRKKHRKKRNTGRK